MTSHRNTGLAYAGVTVALIAAIALSGWCWGSLKSSGLPGLHIICLAIWAMSGVLLSLSQIAFIVIAVRRKHYVVLPFAVAILIAVAVFVFALSQMPS
jgi:hypothetical protein